MNIINLEYQKGGKHIGDFPRALENYANDIHQKGLALFPEYPKEFDNTWETLLKTLRQLVELAGDRVGCVECHCKHLPDSVVRCWVGMQPAALAKDHLLEF